MLTTPHILVGAACGIISRDPVLAFAAGFVSHLLCDLAPHHDPDDYLSDRTYPVIVKLISVFDILIGVGILVFLLQTKTWPVFHLAKWGAIGATSIDVVDNLFSRYICPPFGRSRIGRKITAFHLFFHTHTPPQRWILGIVPQSVSTVGGVALVWYL